MMKSYPYIGKSKASSEYWGVISADFNDLKPLTAEDEPMENLIKITDKYRNQELSIQEIIAKATINGEIKGLSYKPK